MNENELNQFGEEKLRKPIVRGPKKERRFFATLLDLFFVTLLSLALFYSISLPVSKSMTNFEKNNEASSSLRTEMYDMQVDAHLISLDENGNELSLKDALNNFIDMKLNNDNYEEDGSLKDDIAYFYINHRKILFPNDETKYDMVWLNVNIYGLPLTTNATNYSQIFEYQKNSEGLYDQSEFAILRKDNGYYNNLKAYREGKLYDETIKSYELIKDWYLKAITDAKSIVGKSKDYMNLYQEYIDCQVKMTWTYSYATFPTFIFSLIIFFIIVPLFFKKGQTFGKLILKIGVFKENGVYASKTQLLARGIIQSLELLGLYFLVSLFEIGPLFSLTLPIAQFNFGVINGVTLILFSGAILLVSFLMMVFSSNSRSLHDFVGQCKVVDLRISEVHKNEEEYKKRIYELNEEE